MYLNKIDQLIDILLNIYYFKLLDNKLLILFKNNNKTSQQKNNKLLNNFNLNKKPDNIINKKLLIKDDKNDDKKDNKKDNKKDDKKILIKDDNEFIKKFDTIIKFINNFIDEYKIKNLFIEKNLDEQIKDYILDININEMDNKTITLIIITYLYFYIFLLFSYYIEDNDEFINILLNINKNYETNFLSPANISELSKYHQILRKVLFLLDDLDNLDNYKDNIEYSAIVRDLKTLDVEILKKLFLVNIDLKPHNIVKYILFNEKYLKNEKKVIYKIIENSDLINLEYKYIDIVETIFEKIDYVNIESLFDYKNKNMSEDIYNMLLNDLETEDINKEKILENKINKLFEKKILIPITEDFLRYHKDTESYDNNIGSTTKIDIKDRTNKRNNTKIRYIVTKLNKIIGLYNDKNTNDKKEEIKKIFYQPMINRNVVLINDIEETNIIRKLNLQIDTVIQNNEYYSDLVKLRQYSYINFKYLSKDGFSLYSKKTLDAIRYTNFQKENKNNNIEWRVIIPENKVNIVGVILSNDIFNKNIISRIYCDNMSKTVNINIYNKNGYKTMLYLIKNLILDNKKLKNYNYWLFDKKYDLYTNDKFSLIKNNTNDYYINLLSNIYDNISKLTYEKIIYLLKTLKYKNLNYIKNIIKKTEENLIEISDITLLSKIYIIIYYIILECNRIIYDKNDNKIPGFDNNLIKLPFIKIEKPKIPVIYISQNNNNNIIKNDDYIEDAICQHTITWKNILKHRKYDANKFNQLLYEFTKKYIIDNISGDYICRSCNEMIEINKYVSNYLEEDNFLEYNINNNTNNMILEVYLDTELENITGYDKYNKLIKNLDREIDRLVNYIDYKFYIGSSTEYKLRRHVIIKNMIDLVAIQYETLYSKKLEDRNNRTKLSKEKYGCKETETYFFKNDNELFTFSSKEEDKFKFIKRNIIYCYMIICLIIEINNNQIIYFTLDKITNYVTFEKIGYTMFDNLKIHINKTDNLVEMKKYKLLCYVIYYLSGILINKYNLWYSESIKHKSNNLNKDLQRKFIHTFCDLLNSILYNNITNKQNYLYNTISTKFYQKIKNVYSSKNADESLKLIESINKKKVSIVENKLKYNMRIIEPLQIKDLTSDSNIFLKSSFGLNNIYNIYSLVYKSEKYIKKINYINEISNNYNTLKTKLYDDTLIKLAILYNMDGTKRTVPLNDTTNLDKMKKEDYDKLINNIREVRLKNIKKIENKNKLKDTNNKLRNTKAEKIISVYTEIINKTNIENYTDQFIDEIENIIGKDININNQNIYLRHTVYTIDHDYTGLIKEPIIILSNENKIKFKKNDEFFKQDIYYYLDQTNNITMYYSVITRQYIGYKEQNKEYTLLSNYGCFLKIQESINNKLKFLGFNYLYYEIDNKKTENDDIINIANYAINKRILNIKNIINQTQKIIYQIKNKSSNINSDIITSIFIKKLSNIITINDQHDRIFGDWIKFNDYITSDYINNKYKFDLKKINNNKTYLSIYNLLHSKTLDQVLLVYYIDNLLKLTKLQKDDYHKINVIYMILNIIDQQYKNHLLYNDTNYDINTKKLKMSLMYDSYFYSEDAFYQKDNIDYDNMSDEQIKLLKEESIDNYEMENALDYVNDEADKDFGDEDNLILDRVSGDY